MKEYPFIYQLFEALAGIAFFVPAAFALCKKQVRTSFFIPFISYWAWGGLINFIFLSGFIVNGRIISIIESLYNLTDAPLLLFMLYLALPSSILKQKLKWLAPSYLFVEIVIFLASSSKGEAETVLVGTGIIIVICCITGIVFKLWKSKEQNPASPKMFIYYALMFEYGVSIITFIFNYIFPESNNVRDSFLIFHIAVIVAIIIASYGLLNYAPVSPLVKSKPARSREHEVEIRFL